jgi:hypothetical protein
LIFFCVFHFFFICLFVLYLLFSENFEVKKTINNKQEKDFTQASCFL